MQRTPGSGEDENTSVYFPADLKQSARIVKALKPIAVTIHRSEDDTFVNAIWPIIVVGQCFGQLPVAGIRPGQQMHFGWRKIRTLWACVYVTVSAMTALLYMRQILRQGVNARNFVGQVFFTFACFTGLLFLFLAQRWTKLCATWSQNEAVFVSQPYSQVGGTLRLSTKIRLTGAFFMSLALLEHLMFFMSSLHGFFTSIRDCPWTMYEQWQVFATRQFGHIFYFMPFSTWLAVAFLYFNFCFTFAWNYMDIFIMLISIALATRFQQINERLARLSCTTAATGASVAPKPHLWLEVRTHYVQLCELLETVDIQLAPIILLSSANNLYFICFQLLNIFNKLPHVVNEIYFWYSLLYLIGRTACVFLAAAAVHDASRRPLEYIRHAHTVAWCTDLERFGDQVNSELIALSGMRFFHMTRKLLFGMAGTIVTYELVLLQIDAETRREEAAAAAGPVIVDPNRCVLPF